MTTQASIVATLTEEPSESLLADLSARVEILEIRDDLVRGLDPDWLRDHFSGRLLYTLRSRDEGGSSDSSGERRRKRLVAAAGRFDLVDLELERDLQEDVLAAVPAAGRILSWHGPPSGVAELQAVFERMRRYEAHLYKVVPKAEQPRQETAPLALLRSQRRHDLVAFATGEIGTWTRFIAPRLGAPVVFGAASDKVAAAGQPTVEKLVTDYLLPELPEVERLFGLVGLDIGGSLSPRLHTTLYRDLGLPCLYLPFHVESFGEFWLEVVESGAFEELGFRLQGLSVTAPYKRIAAAVAGATSPLVEWLGSANTLVNQDGVWEAESTDGEGVVLPLRSRLPALEGANAAVIGTGGAGRAAAVALRNQGVDVTLVNRSEDRGRRAARDLRLPFRSLQGFDPAGFRVVVNATSLGLSADDPLPVDPERLSADTILVDLVYHPHAPTRLVAETRAAGRESVDGREVLVAQAMGQFRLMTGAEMSIDRAQQIVGLR